MKQFILHALAFLGVIFLLLIIGLVYFVVTDPYNLRPLIFGGGVPSSFQTTQGGSNSSAESVEEGGDTNTASGESGLTGGFALSEAQKQALISVGIDPSAVPSSISAEQEACFISVLGAERVAEIKAGAVPNAIEFFRAKDCV